MRGNRSTICSRRPQKHLYSITFLETANIDSLHQLTKTGGVIFRFLIFIMEGAFAGKETGSCRRYVCPVRIPMAGKREKPATQFSGNASDCPPKSGIGLKIFTRLVNVFYPMRRIPCKTSGERQAYRKLYRKCAACPRARGGDMRRMAGGNGKIIHRPCWRWCLPEAFRRRQTSSSGRHWFRDARIRRRHTGGWRPCGRVARSAARLLHPVCGLRL